MRVITAVVLATVLVAWPPQAHAADLKFDRRILAQLDAAPAAEVLVMLQEPSSGRRRNLSTRQRAIAAGRRAVISAVSTDDVRVDHEFSLVSGFTAHVTRRGLERLAAHPAVVRIDPMRYGSGALAQSVPQIRADAVHGHDDLGQNVTVAVLDTGVDPSHPDLAGSIAGEECFCSGNCCPNGSSRQSGSGSAFTTFVHGIHVTGIIVSKGIVAPVGVAPMAKVVAIKVLNDENRGSLADWIRGLDWIAANRPDVQAVNMSLVSDAVFPGNCDDSDSFNMAFAQALNALRARGVLTFVASGNVGEIDQIASPACVSAAVAVGAVDKTNRVAVFSDSSSALDLLAPGANIVSTAPGQSTATLTGTSMAAPHATGVAALLLAINPTLTASQQESVLTETGVRVFDDRNGLTVPRVDALAAMNAALRLSSPLPGGGSGRTDCLVEWSIAPSSSTVWRPVAGVVCHDNDPACDGDQTPGQCTFNVSVCFNVPDRRLPRCDTTAAITRYQLFSPSASGDAVDAANAAAISAVLPPLPISESNRCTAPVPFVVPAAQAPRWIRFTARAADGRADPDRLRLTCLQAE